MGEAGIFAHCLLNLCSQQSGAHVGEKAGEEIGLWEEYRTRPANILSWSPAEHI